jgi:thiamine monophosphate kinase
VYAGGDTKEEVASSVVGTAVGIIPKDGFLPRTSVRPGDQLYCAGLVGGFAGAYFMQEEIARSNRMDEGREYIDYLSTPIAQWEVANRVNAEHLAHAGMDASDGLLDVLQTFASMRVRVEINLEKIPYHQFARVCADRTRIPLTQLIFGGGDWNILYCISPESSARADSLHREGLPLFQIGQITEGDGVFAIDPSGKEFFIEGIVNEHFANRIEDADGFMHHLRKGNYLHAI